jgi:hypothetical protein
MKPNDFEKWYGKTFVRISKPKTDAELKSKLLMAQLACSAISYSIYYS